MPQSSFKYGLLERIQDVTVIFKGIWFLLLFDAIAVAAFLCLQQGADVLLAIAEDIGNAKAGPATTIWLVVALFFWSIASEFSTRFLIYLSDNSGYTLSLTRVKARQRNQRVIARASLFLPQIILILAFLKVYIANNSDIENMPDHYNVGMGIIKVLIFLVLSIVLLYLLYKRNGILNWLAGKYRALRWLVISMEERNWVANLYGIFSDIRVDIPKTFTQYSGVNLPRQQELPNGMTLPASQWFIPDPANPQADRNRLVWMFTIDRRFYKCLLQQLLIMACFSVAIILLFSCLLPTGGYIAVGAIAIICFGFACWQVIYVCLHLADKIQKWIPIRFILLIMFLVTTFFNKDHPARILSHDINKDNRLSLQAHFVQWFSHLQADTVGKDYYRVNDSVPVIFIAAEGGALRTGAFTAMMLSKLADTFPLLTKYIYCYSSVSGGSVGANLFNAALMQHQKMGTSELYYPKMTNFFKNDFLAPVTGKLVFGEIINYFIPRHIDQFDRAVALEEGWEYAWNKDVSNDSLLSHSFDQTTTSSYSPAVFINTTESETGQQCIWSNVRLDSLPYSGERDLNGRYKADLRYSTAINLSSRFPLVSPGAGFYYTDTTNVSHLGKEMRRHYVDGGYYENKGAETLLQVLQALPLTGRPIKPYIIQFNFGENDSTFSKGVRSFNELTEILAGIYDTRGGRGVMAQHYLHKCVNAYNGEFVNLYMPLNTAKFPLNWVLSNTAVSRLRDSITRVVAASSDDKAELRKLFVYKPTLKKCSKEPHTTSTSHTGNNLITSH